MGRLPKGQREKRKWTIWQMLFGGFGMREKEISEELGVDRRTINNYLRELEDEGKASHDGWVWYGDRD